MLEIKVNQKGAELSSVKLNGVEKLHDGATFWNKHAPILFPIVGKLKEDKTIIEDQEYHMTQHGFARDMEFEKIKVEENLYYQYQLKATKQTLQKYPYLFSLFVTYKINKNSLKVIYTVKNEDQKDMIFGIGAHPAFKIDVENQEYYLEFQKEERNIIINKLEEGLINKKPLRDFLKEDRIISITKELFQEDALILNNISSNTLSLYNKTKKKKEFDFDFTGFPSMGIWSKPNAPFICIEPWYTTADRIDSTGYLKDKANILMIKPKEEFKCEYIMKFYNT